MPDQAEDSVVCPSCNSKFKLSGDQAETVDFSLGRMIGHFEIRTLLGEGHFGSVYSAFDTKLERIVALKIPRDGRLSKNSISDFLKEARAASAIRHPNVLQVYEVGQIDERPYIVTEFIEGISLANWLRSRETRPRHLAEIMCQICDGVHAAHASGVIHRDLKPSNVLMDSESKPHVADFGLAKRLYAQDMTVTKNGAVFGTPAYMSPEQATGEVDKIKEASDVFSLGVCFYQMLSGKLPFQATDSYTVMHLIRTEAPMPLRSRDASIPRDLQTICFRALEKLPERRYPSAKEMKEDLGRFLEGRTIEARPVSPITRGWRWLYVNRMPAALAAMFVALSAVSLLLMKRQSNTAGSVPVNIKCVMPGVASGRVNWTFAKLDSDRLPMRSKVIRHTNASLDLHLDLDPGEYLVVVEAPGIGFHEVYRRIPEDRSMVSGKWTPIQFQFVDGTVQLPDVTLKRSEEISSDLVFIRGGDFVAGDKGNPFAPETEFQIDDFWIQATEVTFESYSRIAPPPALYKRSSNESGQSDFPIVGVSFYQAAHYAEAIGCRLISELEWQYVCTNGGTTNFPWGDEKRKLPWQLEAVASNIADVASIGEVYGLMSNCSEITSTPLRPYPGGEMRAEAHVDGFVYKGGPFKLPPTKGLEYSADSRLALADRNAFGDFLGFRCARSSSPWNADSTVFRGRAVARLKSP